MQNFTSRNTSINSTKLPTVFRKVKQFNPIIFDYGCGRYTDHIRKHLLGKCVYLPYDPYNKTPEDNKASKFVLSLAIKDGYPVDVVCSNVLNVIDDQGTIESIAKEIETIITTTGGTGYITVYEGNKSGIGRQTGPDQYQRNEPIKNYLKYFSHATIKNGVITVSKKR